MHIDTNFFQRSYSKITAIVFATVLGMFLSNSIMAFDGNAPVFFTINNGQFNQNVKFQSRTGNSIFSFSENSVLQTSFLKNNSDDVLVTKLSFLNANQNVRIEGVQKLNHKSNYFIGANADKWQTDIDNFSSVKYSDMYSGIDLLYYPKNNSVEYDYIVSPYADYNQILMKYDNVESIYITENGDLEVVTKFGSFYEQKPYAYQTDMLGNKNEIKSKFVVFENNSFGFKILEPYDKSRNLIIDPILTYSSFLASDGGENIRDVAIDNSGNIYVTGTIFSATNFPIVNEYQDLNDSATGTDVFITKFSADGSSLLYSTFIGGSSNDDAYAITIDNSGNAYVTGRTASGNPAAPNFTYPITAGVVQQTHGGGTGGDAFITKLNSTGNNLVYSTFIGGTATELGYDISLNSSNEAVIVGDLNGSGFPTFNPIQPRFGNEISPVSPSTDAFITVVNSTGTAFVFSSFLGGRVKESAFSVVVDGNDQIIVGGITSSHNFPFNNALFDTYNHVSYSGQFDGFITKINSMYTAWEFSTYFGGDGIDSVKAITLDYQDNILITGGTTSSDFPDKNSTTLSAIGTDIIYSVLSNNGTVLLDTELLGGSQADKGNSIASNSLGETFITGETSSLDLSGNNSFAFNPTNSGQTDAFIYRIRPVSENLFSYLGGSELDKGNGVAIGIDGEVIIAGITYSNETTFPILNALYPIKNTASFDGFVTKVRFSNCCINTRGNADGSLDDAADISDLIFITDLIFTSGPDPICFEEGDVDGLGNDIDISDVVYIVDFIFTNGPEPPSCP